MRSGRAGQDMLRKPGAGKVLSATLCNIMSHDLRGGGSLVQSSGINNQNGHDPHATSSRNAREMKIQSLAAPDGRWIRVWAAGLLLVLMLFVLLVLSGPGQAQ